MIKSRCRRRPGFCEKITASNVFSSGCLLPSVSASLAVPVIDGVEFRVADLGDIRWL